MEKRIKTSKGPAIIFYDKNITPKTKKYSVITPNGKLIHFGARNYEQYKDTALGKYSKQNHLDKNRRENYQTRHKNDYINNPEYAGYYSWKYLW